MANVARGTSGDTCSALADGGYIIINRTKRKHHAICSSTRVNSSRFFFHLSSSFECQKHELKIKLTAALDMQTSNRYHPLRKAATVLWHRPPNI